MNKIAGVFVFLLMGVLASAQIEMKKENGGVLVSEKNRKVLFYQAENKNQEGKFERCNYIHPLWATDGTVLTEDFPADHLHHRGIFWAWHQVWIDGQRIGDPWEIKNFEQEVTNIEIEKGKKGAGILKTEVNWKSDLWQKNDRKVPYLREKTKITINPEIKNYRRIDVEIQLLALAENLKIGGSEDVKGYSGFSVRMVLPEDVTFLGPEGVVEPMNEAVQSPGYVNVIGSLLENGKKGGVVMVDYPENPGYPQNWILRKKNSMQNVAWPGNTTVSISTEKPLILSYSLIIYSGDLSTAKIKKIIRK